MAMIETETVAPKWGGLVYRYSLSLVILLYSASAVAGPSGAVSELLPQYPRAELAEFSDSKTVSTHEIVTGSLRSKGGTTGPEDSRFVAGRRVASTWHVPDEQRTDRVYEFYKERIVAMGDVLFECKGYECGSSNHWANNIFGRAILYGPPQDQHYLLTRIDRGSTYYVALYVTMRGTRKLYVHTDVIVSETQYADIGGAAIVDDLKSRARFVIDPGAEEAVVDAVAEAMSLEPLMRIAVVSHERKQTGESVEQSIQRSQQVADRYRSTLIDAGVNRTRLQAHGVGPLSPMDRNVVDRIELVLISID